MRFSKQNPISFFTKIHNVHIVGFPKDTEVRIFMTFPNNVSDFNSILLIFAMYNFFIMILIEAPNLTKAINSSLMSIPIIQKT